MAFHNYRYNDNSKMVEHVKSYDASKLSLGTFASAAGLDKSAQSNMSLSEWKTMTAGKENHDTIRLTKFGPGFEKFTGKEE